MDNTDDISKDREFNQRIILIILLFTIFSGAIRKWVIDSGTVITLITYIQIPILFIFTFLKKDRNQEKQNFEILVAYIFYLIVLAISPLTPSIYHAISGIIIHLGFWLALALYISRRNYFETDYLFKIILIAIVIEILLGFFQYAAPRDSFLNKYASTKIEDDLEGLSIATVGDAVRISGTFPYISGYVSFLLFLQLFNFSLFYNPKIPEKAPLYLSLVIFLLTLLTGSRACLLFIVLSSSSFFLWQYKSNNKLKLGKYLVYLILLLIFNAGLSDPLKINGPVENIYNNFNTRLEANSEEGEGRLTLPFERLLYNNFPNQLFGNGLAISYPGIVALKGTTQVAIDNWVQDDEVSRIILEGGYLLLIFKLAIMILLIKQLKINRIFSTVIFTIVFLYFPLSGNIYNSVFFLIGIIYLDQSILKFNENNRIASG